MTKVVSRLDIFYAFLLERVPLRRVAWPVRILLALGFLPSGMTKLSGQHFTRLPASDPVGGFFAHLEAMGGLYFTIGLCQVVAAALLLIPATALLGALVYLPVITGIVVITWTIPFGNTRYITTAMFLGTALLLALDWPRLRYLLLPRPVGGSATP